MNCPTCHKVLEEGWKVCPFCEQKVITSGQIGGLQDTVVSHSPGAGSNYAPVINLSSQEQKNPRCPNCDLDISNENKPLKCLECGEKFCEHCEGFYRNELRQRGENRYVISVIQP